MKIFTYKNRVEGESMVRDSMITIGRNIDSSNESNGFYAVFRSPFKKMRSITSPETFENETVPTRTTFAMMVRRYRGNGPWLITRFKEFFPA